MAKRDKDNVKVPAKTAERSQALAPEAGSSKAVSRGAFEHPLVRLRAEMDSLFDRFFTGWPTFANWGASGENTWGLDVEENENDIVVRAQAPGFEPSDFDIHVSGNMLTIKAEHKGETSKTDEGYRYSEQSFSSFRRSVPLSTAVDADKIDAYYRDGKLELRLPRTEGVAKRRIEVKT
jgi:HSP20 family protein